MRKNAIISPFLVWLFLLNLRNASAQDTHPNGFNKFYYENGALSSEGTMRDGKPDGYWKNFYRNGNLKIEGNRKNFLLDSIWKFYSENGKLNKTVDYREGKRNGYTCSYDTLVRLLSREHFVNDIKQGNSYQYYPSGKTRQVVPYVNGKPDGIAYEYSEDSLIITISKYQGGILATTQRINRRDENGKKQGLWKDFYADGAVKSERRYRDDLVDGYIKEYDTKGNLQKTTKFNNGKEIKNAPELAALEVYKGYSSGGILEYEGGYVNGMPVGTHYHYKKQYRCDSVSYLRDDTSDVYIKKQICRNIAIPDSAMIYTDGVLTERGPVDSLRNRIGNWYEYHLSGEFKAKGLYANDRRVGDWIFYYPNGQIEQRGKYDKRGRAQGSWKWFYDNGALMREENYLDNKREGTMTDYAEDGKVLIQGDYVDGQEEGIWNYETTIYKETGRYTAGKQDSIWKSYYMPSGKLRFEGKFLNGDPEGKHTAYYENGKTMFTGSYVGGLRQGDWKYYDEAGYNYLTVTYDNDIEIKFQGVKVTPTYEESLRDYSSVKRKATEETINLDK